MSTQRSRAPMTAGPGPNTAADPLWGLVSVLGDIARRVERRRAEEHTEQTPETPTTAGSDPAVVRREEV